MADFLAAVDALAVGEHSVLPSAGTAALVAEARRLRTAALAERTRIEYAKNWASFVAWAAALDEARGAAVLPAHPALVGLYIAHLHRAGISTKTVMVRMAAIAYAHKLVGADSPTRSPEIVAQLAGLRRQPQGEVQARNALTDEDLAAALERVGPPGDLRDVRDRAIVLLGFSSALRRSNLALLEHRDVRFASLGEERYLEIEVRRSKTDQEGRGRRIVVPELPGNPLCAYRAVRMWLDAAAITDGFLFRSLHFTHGTLHVTAKPIDGRDVARAVKRLCAQAGIDEQQFAAHSLRRGFATSADRRGVRRSLIREQGGWKDDRMLSIYTRHEAVRENAIKEMFLK